MTGGKKAVQALRGLTLLAWLFWWAAYWQMGRRLVRDLRRSFRVRISVLDPLLGVLVALLSPLLLANNVRILSRSRHGGQQAEPSPPAFTLPRTLLGTLLALGGIAGSLYCRICQGRFWRGETTVRPGPVVVDCGPYARVRHPVYTSLMLVYGGTALAFYSRLNVLLVKLIAGAYVLKTLEEDRFLAHNLPGYQAYTWRVPYRLVPGVF
jgi:protein-S-isoprenylcysteine O-methyltransferase Ste14